MSNGHLDTSTPAVPADAGAPGPGWPQIPPLLQWLGSGASMTGPELAVRLRMTRAAVWKQIEAWRREGLEIDAGAQGYRLRRPLDRLDVADVRTRIPAAARRRVGVLENHWQLDSTSSEVMRRADELPDRSFVFADWQRAGRGRRGRQWRSPPACNLQFSCLKRFVGSYASLSGLSLAVGVAAARALEGLGIPGIALKWPNDLVVDDAKLGGILVELGGEFMGPCHAVIGIGINVYLPATTRAALDRPCADLAGLCGLRPPSRNELAAAMVIRLVEGLDAFDRAGFSSCERSWAERDALAGRRVRIEEARGALEGMATGVDPRGALQVRTADGLRCVDSGEVTVRPA